MLIVCRGICTGRAGNICLEDEEKAL